MTRNDGPGRHRMALWPMNAAHPTRLPCPAVAAIAP
jgi:hypothetical protein